ncbi:cytochrome P450 6B7-like isoform X2 [Bombyx mandarina]|uniref:unspecific monooxygenase n=1 Tax=Bombyx mandarina TaxID=7092 RepID=A0A6J2JA73_BOMMA|nr:cytochrome P450 6B7-like isoform X1 [Bombyx mandarina]XP_028026385.1 cytochrome P450 6B7-like isoform X2 [Bombyx mandarina]
MLLLALLLIFSIVIYLYTTRNHNYWAKRGVRHDPPVPFFGNHFRNVFGLKSIIELSVELYNKYPNEKVVGYYRGTEPELIVRDLDIAKNILIGDFVYFHHRGLGRNTDLEPLLRNLFHVDGDAWKLLRKRLTAAFTTAKLKAMFPLVINCAEKMKSVAGEYAGRGGECDVRELMARFSTEFIGACGFGIQMDTINNECSLFRELGRLIFTRQGLSLVAIGLWDLLPELRKYLRLPGSSVEATITEIYEKIRDQRNGKPCGRNDFVDLLLELKQKGVIEGESIDRFNADGTPVQVQLEMDTKSIVAQMFVFFAAGFETSSSATSYTLHQLAFHQEIQKEIQCEIDEVLSRHDNKLCYDAILEMPLLTMAFKEALRMFPSLGNLHRVCTRSYTIPELGITIDPGVRIIIPAQAIQNDAKYFDDPSEFRPKRFAKDSEIKKFSFLPFGAGPRNCIGARLGEMQSLAGLAAILHKFSVEPAPSTVRKLRVKHTQNVVQGVEGGLPLLIKERK